MTLAHEVSASGGLRVQLEWSKGQVQEEQNHLGQSKGQNDHKTITQHSTSSANSTQNQQTSDVNSIQTSRQSSTRAICSSQTLPGHLHNDHSTLLATAKVKANSHSGSYIARVLIDPGSELTLITSHLANLLQLRKHHQTINIRGVESSKLTQTKGVTFCELQSSSSSHSVYIRAHIMKQLTALIPKVLSDPTFNIPQSIDILLGADFYGKIIKQNIIYNSPTAPIAQLSIFGWLILGLVAPNTSVNYYHIHHATTITNHEDIRKSLTKFWVQEEVPMSNQHQLSSLDQQYEDFFKSTHSRHSSGRYIVRIRLISSPAALGDSYTTAYRCLKRQLRRSTSETEYSNLYRQFMKGYEELGHMRPAPTINQESQDIHPYFLPHHGVLRPSSTTTKLRVVFNGSSPTSTGISLNDITYTGAKIQLDNHNKIIPYQLTTVTYGTRSAPYLAVRVLLQLVEDEGHKYSESTQTIIKDRYVDDIFGGADSSEELIQVAEELINLCKASGFPLAKWQSNSQSLFQKTSQSSGNQQKITFEDCTTKILGLQWNPSSDTFTFTSKSVTHESTYSKRLILSEVAQIYDPLGFVSPITIRAKMLLQEL
ncbi:uncharacterized protein [Chelonus insularis]|uniref:uncharacterized protein n=1 Tax=Chelonus insularis TaxID=460826 RepID=UPI00158BBE09|nr:uncharacterized protein LOC118071343 [Chelonus insularis]